ncbi:MAG: hypothetical protein AB1420_02230 [Bacillota bacterium]
MFLFSGIFFPIDNFPGFIQIAAWFLPLFHVVILLRSLVFGNVGLFLLIPAAVLIFTIFNSFPFSPALNEKKTGNLKSLNIQQS